MKQIHNTKNRLAIWAAVSGTGMLMTVLAAPLKWW